MSGSAEGPEGLTKALMDFAKVSKSLSPGERAAEAFGLILRAAWLDERQDACRDPRRPLYSEIERRGDVSVFDCKTKTRRRTSFADAEAMALSLEEKAVNGQWSQGDTFHDLAHLIVALLCHESAKGRAMVMPFGDPPVAVAMRETEGGIAELFVGRFTGKGGEAK